MKNKKSYPKRKVLHGTTPEERFKEVYGYTIVEWHDKQTKQLELELGMTLEEWFIKKVNRLTPLEFLTEYVEEITAQEALLITDLKSLGLKANVINVLFYYAYVVSKGKYNYSLIRLLGRQWTDDNINTIELAIEYAKRGIKEYLREVNG